MKSGDTIRNERSGEWLKLLEGDDGTDGERQLYEVHLPPRRPSPPLHYHTQFTETFTTLSGNLDVYRGAKRARSLLSSGESLTVERGELHTFANDRDEPTVITLHTRPAGGVVRAFRLAYGIANEGGAASDGLPRNPILRLRFIRISQGFLPGIPLPLQKAIFELARMVSGMTGLENRVRKFTES
jgi:mannose-6-phosphate isomerase-like protein (cupin superfamily)